MRLDTLYAKADIKRKREIIGSMYPEKLTFDGFTYRTARVNEAARLIYILDKGFKEMKNGKSNGFSRLSRWVVPTGPL